MCAGPIRRGGPRRGRRRVGSTACRRWTASWSLDGLFTSGYEPRRPASKRRSRRRVERAATGRQGSDLGRADPRPVVPSSPCRGTVETRPAEGQREALLAVSHRPANAVRTTPAEGVSQQHVITNSHVGNRAADGGDHPGAFVSRDDREVRDRVLAIAYVEVGTADAGGCDTDRNLAGGGARRGRTVRSSTLLRGWPRRQLCSSTRLLSSLPSPGTAGQSGRGRSAHVPWTRAERVPLRQATVSGLPERPWGAPRQALLLDVKEALVDEFVDAEGA